MTLPRRVVTALACAALLSAIVPLSTITAAPADLVLYAADARALHGTWQRVADGTAAGGTRLWHPNAGAPKVTSAAADPRDYFELAFEADAGRAYRLWMRGRAESDSYLNDSVYVQFSGSVTASGAPV